MEKDVSELQETLVDIIIKNSRYLDISIPQIHDFAEIIADRALLTRFLRKHKDLETTEIAILSHLDWRLNENIVELKFKELFYFSGLDINGRPTCFITPKMFNPKEVDVLKSSVLLLLEVLRKWIMVLNNSKVQQALIVVDLQGFGMANMDFELIPVIYDIFKQHYPQLLGQCLVLNYGWLHAGIWAVVKQILTEEAKKKLVFLNSKQLVNYIPVNNLPVEYGGLFSDKGTIKRYSDPVYGSHYHEELHRIVGVLTERNSLLYQPQSSSPELFFDALSYPERPVSIRSAADLQSLLKSHGSRNNLARNSSVSSLASISMRSRSQLSLAGRNASLGNLSRKSEKKSKRVIFKETVGSVVHVFDRFGWSRNRISLILKVLMVMITYLFLRNQFKISSKKLSKLLGRL